MFSHDWKQTDSYLLLQYITCQVLRSRYGTIAENGPPQTLTRVFWFNVLNYYFSSVDGFSPEHNYIPNLNTPLVKSELAVSRLEDKSLKAFMVIDCTKRDIEGHDDEWRKSYDQFKAHLQEVFRNEQRDTGAGVLYGAVTIGRYIRFYILKRGDAEMQNYGPVNTAGQPQAWETLRALVRRPYMICLNHSSRSVNMHPRSKIIKSSDSKLWEL